jgi:MATE family multidrug resistance protein
MIGWLGAKALAAHQIAINLASITYMAALGVSAAGAIRVGNALGRRNRHEVRVAGFTAILIAVTFMGCAGIIFVLFNHMLPRLYINDELVISKAADLLIMAALFQLSDGTQAIGLGILRGLTDVKVSTVITFIAYWVLALPIGYILGFKYNYGVYGVWTGYIIGLTASAIMLTLRFNLKSKQI